MNEIAKLSIVLLLVLSLPSGIILANAQQPLRGGALVIVPGLGQCGSLGPFESQTPACTAVMNIYSSLVRLDSQANAVPDLAQTWSISPDGLIYTFNLVHNAKFHDGVPVTSADVKFSMEQIHPKYTRSGYLLPQMISKIETPDNYTVVITLKSLQALDFLKLLAMGDGVSRVAPKHIYEGTDILTNPANQKPVGSGPYKFLEWVKGDHTTIVRNENYWKNDRPYIDKIVFKNMKDYSTFIAAMQNGEVDLMPAVGTDADLKTLSEVRASRQAAGKGLIVEECCLPLVQPGNELLGFNLRKAPGNDLKVRQAIAYAIDRDAIVQYVGYGFGKASYGPIPPSIQWAYDHSVEKTYPFDPTKGEQILEQAGYKKGADGFRLPLSLMISSTSTNEQKMAEVLRQQLGKIGIDVKIQVTDYSIAVDKLANSKDFQAYIWLYSYGFDWQVSGRPAFDYRAGGAGIRHDPTGYNNSRALQLFDQDLATPDKAKRQPIMYEIQKVLMTDLPFIGVWEPPFPWLYREGVRGIPANLDAGATFFENAWVDWAPKPATTTVTTTSAAVGLSTETMLGIAVVIVAIVAVAGVYYARVRKKPGTTRQ